MLGARSPYLSGKMVLGGAHAAAATSHGGHHSKAVVAMTELERAKQELVRMCASGAGTSPSRFCGTLW